MSMDKAIESGKEHRKQYYGIKAIDKACRNGGSCIWCQMGRQHKNKKKMLDKIEEEVYNDDTDSDLLPEC